MLKNSKGLLIALAAVIALGGGVLLAKSRAPLTVPAAGTETSAELAASAPVESKPAPEAPAAAAPAPEASTTPAPDTAAATAAPAATATAASSPAATPDIDMNLATAEHVLGRDDAPVTVIEYASLTCPHCAYFATTLLPEIKTKLIDTGKMKLIFRDFPIDLQAVKAAKLARCAPADKYFDFVEVIFKNRDRWLANTDPAKGLMQLGALAGMDDTYMQNCMGNVELENFVMRGVSEAQAKFQVKATPTFVFNYGAETLAGAQDEAKFEEVINRLSAGK